MRLIVVHSQFDTICGLSTELDLSTDVIGPVYISQSGQNACGPSNIVLPYTTGILQL